jgi:hypothetical protein
MTARRLEDQFGEVAERVLGTLAEDEDEVTYGVRYASTFVEHVHNGEQVLIDTPCVSLWVSLHCPEHQSSVSGAADLPLPAAATPEGFARGLEQLWDHLNFRRIEMNMPDVRAVGQAIINAEG